MRKVSDYQVSFHQGDGEQSITVQNDDWPGMIRITWSDDGSVTLEKLDNDGNILSIQTDFDGDGVADQRSVFETEEIQATISPHDSRISYTRYENEAQDQVFYEAFEDGSLKDFKFVDYDENGNKISEYRFDSTTDFSLGTLIKIAYNNQGLIESVERYNDDGSLSSLIQNEYNADGLLFKEILTYNDVLAQTLVYSYDADGRLEESNRWAGLETDQNGDPLHPVYRYNYQYETGTETETVGGNQYVLDSNITIELADAGADGSINRVERVTTWALVDENGQQIGTQERKEIDYTGDSYNSVTGEVEDSGIDRIVLVQYNLEGEDILRKTVSVDSNGTQTLELLSTYEYDENGNRLEFASESNGDGIIDRRTIYEYSEDGSYSATYIDVDGDNNVVLDQDGNIDKLGDWETKYENDFDEDGRIIASRQYSNMDDQNPVSSRIYEYEDLKQITEWRDSDGDGFFDRQVVSLVDAAGSTRLQKTDFDLDGLFDEIKRDTDGSGILDTTDTYDDVMNLQTRAIDVDGDGNNERLMQFHIGTNDPDTLTGTGGDDVLLGLRGDDELIGGAGDDRLFGGAGDDILTGGTGSDIFLIDYGIDTVTDFEDGVDQLDFSSVYGVDDFADLTVQIGVSGFVEVVGNSYTKMILQGITDANLITADDVII